jgi:hypothetical protein
MFARAAALVAIAIVVAGCYRNAALEQAIAPLRYTSGGQPLCDQSSCTEQWQRAQVWISNHSKYKIRTATDVLIDTFNPTGYDPSYGFTVTREPVGDGQYAIAMRAVCGNFLGCKPRIEDVGTAFYSYVRTGQDALLGVRNLSGIR